MDIVTTRPKEGAYFGNRKKKKNTPKKARKKKKKRPKKKKTKEKEDREEKKNHPNLRKKPRTPASPPEPQNPPIPRTEAPRPPLPRPAKRTGDTHAHAKRELTRGGGPGNWGPQGIGARTEPKKALKKPLAKPIHKKNAPHRVFFSTLECRTGMNLHHPSSHQGGKKRSLRGKPAFLLKIFESQKRTCPAGRGM